MSKTTTCLIADDHPIFRQGVRSIMEKVNDIKVVAEAENGESALNQLGIFNPDILLLDLAMPGMDGISVLKTVRTEFPEMRIIIITSYKDKVYLEKALELGANGFVLKDDAGENLVDCMRIVLSGEIYVSPIFGTPGPKLPLSDENGEGRLSQLTRAECKVLILVARYLTSKEIAAELNISHRTVQNHRTNISQKLGIKGIHQLANFAHQHQEQLSTLFDLPPSKTTQNPK